MSEIHKTAPDSEKAFRKDLENAIVYLDQISSNLTHSTSLLIQSLFLKSQKIQSQISQKKFFYTSMLEYLSLPISSHIESFLSNHDFSHGSSLFTDISEAQKKIEDFFETEIFSDIKNVWQDEYLIFSDRNSNIKKVDLLSLQMNKLEYFNGFIAGGCQGCKVSEDLYFINGGIDEQRQSYNNSYMIDIANEKTIEYPDSIGKRFVAACVCKDDKVYIFGGFSYKNLEDSEVLDLNSRVWTQIAPLPLASYWNTGTVVEKSIYLTGFFIGGLLNYSESLNTYTQICELPENTCKLVLGNWALVSDSNEVLEIKNGVVKNWRMAMPWHGYYLLYSCTFRRGKWIYFVEGHLNEKKGIFLRRFDVIEKKIEDLEYIE